MGTRPARVRIAVVAVAGKGKPKVNLDFTEISERDKLFAEVLNNSLVFYLKKFENLDRIHQGCKWKSLVFRCCDGWVESFWEIWKVPYFDYGPNMLIILNCSKKARHGLLIVGPGQSDDSYKKTLSAASRIRHVI